MHPWVWYGVMLANGWTLALFGWDKLCAMRQARRVRERTLLGWMFATGLVGGWCAMALFRHKTAKASFRRWALLWTVCNPLWVLLWVEFGRS